MVAGSVGILFDAGGDNSKGLDRVQPLSGWWVYEKRDGATGVEKDEQKAFAKRRRAMWKNMEAGI